MTAEYNATKNFYASVSRKISVGNTMFSQDEAKSLMNRMVEMFPFGSKVRGTVLNNIYDLNDFKIIEGTVVDVVMLTDEPDEPHFIIRPFSGGTWVLRGSVLTII